MTSDGLAHLMGWLFFRIDRWRLPLGSIKSLLYPHGTTTGFTDSIPWAAVLFKLLSPILPLHWQYFGPWLAMCFALNGFIGAKIVRQFSPLKIEQAAGGALFAVVATLNPRLGHESLCAHWELLLAIWLNLEGCASPRGKRRLVLLALGLNVLGAGTHPYLELMILPLTVAFFVRLWLTRQTSLPKAASLSALAFGLAFATLRLFGYIGGDQLTEAGGFGEFSADLATFINPGRVSNFFGPLPCKFRQYEGYAYLGAGVLGLISIGFLGLLARPRDARRLRWRRYVPVTSAALLLALFAAASPLTWLGDPVLSLDALYAPFPQITGPFRASGRFIWPLHYVAITFAVGAVSHAFRFWRRLPAALFAAALTAQVIEINPTSALTSFKQRQWSPLSSPAWSLVARPYRHVALYPPMIQWVCPRQFDESLVASVGFAAYASHMTFNSGYVARVGSADFLYCEQLASQIARGELDPATVYVVANEERAELAKHGATCGSADGLVVCVTGQSTPLSEYLRAHP